MTEHTIGITAALLSALAWAAGAVMYRKFGERLSSAGMNLAKGMINLLLLAVTVLLIGYSPMSVSAFVLLGISGIVGIAVGDTLFFEALKKIGPQVLVVLSLFGQVLTVLFAILFLGEKPTPMMWAGIVLVTAGVAYVVFPKTSGGPTPTSRGIGLLCGIGAVLAMSASVVVAKQGMASISAAQATFVRMLSGTAGLLVWGTVRRTLPAWVEPFCEAKLAGKFFLLVCLVSFGGFWLFHAAIKYTDVSVANTLTSTEPLFVIPLAAIFLKEKISKRMTVGTVIAVLGIVLLSS